MQSVTTLDDVTPANQVKVDYSYDQYGNVTDKREYGFKAGGLWRVQRRARTVYKTDSSYTSAFLRSLPIEVDLYDAQQDTSDANDVVIAKATYAYDNYVAMGGMEDYGGTADPAGHYSSYNTSVTLRGNLTGSSEYIDLVANTTNTRLTKYDIFGNVVKAQVSCCQEKDLTISEATYWSQPESVMSGDPAGEHRVNSAHYDFNTSAATDTTDPAGVKSAYSYDAMLRPTGVALSNSSGVTLQNTLASFNNSALTSSSSIYYDDAGVSKVLTSTKQYDG